MVIHKYHPDWKPPRDTGRKWIPTLCPFHGDSTQSASVSYQNNAFNCFTCGVKGDAWKLLMKFEEVNYATAKRIAAELSPGSDRTLPAKPARQSRRRVFGDAEPGVPVDQRKDGPVHARIRGRPTPWS
ncbi:CHC2 zinc finger domain-containing protein [Nocardia sp. NPDC055002]